ncbi:histone H4 transcription factor-like [Mytilus trossulus]|uniref:histone H4 transcription factor-like n=1 Tax=Mytilus trossulus TaxID=6551 RepID=UPI003007D22F
MPPKPNTKETKILMSELMLLCEWGECSHQFNNMEEFLSHMSQHLIGHHYEVGRDDPNTDGEFPCEWRECNTMVQGRRTDFLRHAYFHCFHVKIKNIGEQMIRKMGLRGCLLENQSRNLIPELPERLQCGWNMCETIIDNPEIFYRHVDNHSETFPEGNNLEHGARCEWEGCETVAKNKYKLREHLRSHTQEKVIACPTCGGLFSSRTKFVDHVKRQAGVESQCYQCSHCNKRFSSERLLRDHVRHHVNQYKCPCCEMTCPTPSSLKSHLRYRHTNEKPFKCDHCDYRAKTFSDLRKHAETHTEAPFTCHFATCKYVTRSFASLTNHFKRKHQEVAIQNYACHVCSSVFTRGSKLTVHLKKKHKFKWPSGHSRFRYKMHEDGYMRLQTVRYESMQLSQNQDSTDGSESKDVNENQDKYVVVHDQSSEMICNDDTDMEMDDTNPPSDVVTIATGDESTGYVIKTTDLQGHQICDLGNIVNMVSQPSDKTSDIASTITIVTQSSEQSCDVGSIGMVPSANVCDIGNIVSMVTQSSENSHIATLTDIDGSGHPREINVTIVEAPEGGFQVVDLSTTKKKKEKHMTYNLEMLSDVAITLPGGGDQSEEL